MDALIVAPPSATGPSSAPRREHHRCLPVAALLLAAAAAGGAPPADTMLVPGGVAAIDRLLGPVETRPDAFAASLVRSLMTDTAAKGDWKSVARRLELVQYLETVRDLQADYPRPVEARGAAGSGATSFADLAERLGFDARAKTGRITLEPKQGEKWEGRRRVALALGWDFPALAEKLSSGGTVSLSIPVEEAPPPLPFALWRSVTGDEVTRENALERLAKDEPFCMVAEGLRRVTSETRATLSKGEMVGWIYRKAAMPFFRYCDAIEIRGGALVIPGGREAMMAWNVALGESPSHVEPFLKALLGNSGARGAFAWHALSFVPRETATFYLGTRRDKPGEKGQSFKPLFAALAALDEFEHFEGPRGALLGLPALVRSIDIRPEGQGLALPGGAGLWWQAVRGADAPTEGADLQSLERKGARRELTDGELLDRLLSSDVTVRGVRRSVLPRLVQVANRLEGRDDLLTPEVVILLARASDSYPMALAALDELTITRPEAVRDYLLVVARLDQLAEGPEKELFLTNFQGGVELLRALARAGVVESSTVEKHWQAWARLHGKYADPYSAAGAQLAWLVDLLRDLPPAAEDAPGRGPLEQALLAAINGRNDPQSFIWGGVLYVGNRGRQLGEVMAGRLVLAAIPSADDLTAIHTAIGDLRTARKAGDLVAFKRTANDLARALKALPTPSFEPALPDKDTLRRFSPTDREEVADILAAFGKLTKPKKLAGVEERVEELARLMSRELRPFLLAPAYLRAMGEMDTPVFDAPDLIRKHCLIDDPSRRLASESQWAQAGIVPRASSRFGFHVVGHLGDVPTALVELHLTGMQTRKGLSLVAWDGYRVWFLDNERTAWPRITPDVSGFVSTLVGVGEKVVRASIAELAAGDGPNLTLAKTVIPLARIERQAADPSVLRLVSPSELLGVGLAILESAPNGPAAGVSEADRASVLAARDRLGSDWRSLARLAGAPSPSINGRTRPWVGHLPPYEALEHEGRGEALAERLLPDLKTRVLDYLGRRGLPGEVGGDLMRQVLASLAVDLHQQGRGDWESFVAWVSSLDDRYLDERMRECLAAELYVAQGL